LITSHVQLFAGFLVEKLSAVGAIERMDDPAYELIQS
jgi:hypothetical protein